jgi:toxin ParE1/3/4
MQGFHLTTKAKADLKSIAIYTQKTWGREQRNRYLTKLDETFHALACEPLKGRACDDIRKGYQKYHIGRHFIFYRQAVDGIDIIRILHDSMNIEDHF